MSEQFNNKVEILESATSDTESKKWLKADFHFHVFHYRMPQTVAIAAVTPFVPSPLTVKMALVAALLQDGDVDSAYILVPYLPKIEVRIIPPSSAFAFKAFLRYRSVPAVDSVRGLDESGSYYPSRPHTREFALLEGEIGVILGLMDTSVLEIVKIALQKIRYLGCKDSLVTCLGIKEIDRNEVEKFSTIQPLQEGLSGNIILGVDFESSASPQLKDLIPGSRNEKHYRSEIPLVLPGKIFVKGRGKIFKKSY